MIVVWLGLAALGNVLVPQLESVVESHSRAFMPDDAPSSIAAHRSAEPFDEVPSNNFVYVVLERDSEISAVDRAYYDGIVAQLRADTDHVHSVTDLWALPVAESAALSRDGKAVNVMVRLAGMLGTSEATESVRAVREIVATTPAPQGLSVFVTGAGATIVDEFTAIDRQMLTITALTVAVILVLLMAVYRSAVAAAIPLLSVGLALAVARPLIAALGQAGLVEVSLFSVALVAAMLLGIGTDYAIFLIGRYQEGRRRGVDRAAAVDAAYRGVAPVIIGSALTIALALACLTFAHVGMLRSAGIPCAIGVLVMAAASLTLTPALLGLAARSGRLEPRATTTARRWRRIGATVARWPGPVLVVAGTAIVLVALPVVLLRVGWNEPSSAPASAESNVGYAAVDRHFPPNSLFPNVVTLHTDQDLRTPAGLIAIERVTAKVMEVPGVRVVQSPSRPAGQVPDEATLAYQAGVAGTQFDTMVASVTQRIGSIGDLDATLAELQLAVDQLGAGLARGADGMTEVNTAATEMHTGMDGLKATVTTMSRYVDPLRDFVQSVPNCGGNPLCAAVGQVVTPVDELVASSTRLSDGAVTLTAGAETTASALAQLPAAVDEMADALIQARSAITAVMSLAGELPTELLQLTDYLRELQAQFAGSASGGFYLPDRALADPRFQDALRHLMSGDGRAVYLLVFGDGDEWGTDGAARAQLVETAVREASKEGLLADGLTSIDVFGVGPATHDLRELIYDDLLLLIAVAWVLIFVIVVVMLRSPVAALVVVGTVAVSYASALGASVLLWQYVIGEPLHWAVAPISFIALVAVGADYNLLLTLRISDELPAGIRTAVMRAFAGTGGVVTTAGIVFGITMLALVGSSVLNIAQIGTTIAVGLLIDTLVIRVFVVPAVAVLLGPWFWWPRKVTRHAERGQGS